MRKFTVFLPEGTEEIPYLDGAVSAKVADCGALVVGGADWSNVYAPGHWVATEDRKEDEE